jgi:RimJ/RimL family protein N-acetyltransferase
MLAVLDRENGSFLGRTGLKHWPQFDEVEVGWVLAPAFWGRGLATEAGRACLEWGLRSLAVPYVTAMIQPENQRSIRVAERLGMAPLRDDFLLGHDVIVYARRRSSGEG